MAYIMSEKKRYSMSEDERAEREKIKAVHKRLREPLRGGRGGDRYDLLAWAFVRGFKYRRCERSNRIQTCGGEPADMHGNPVGPGEKPYTHNAPDPSDLWVRLVRAGVFAAPVGGLPGSWKDRMAWYDHEVSKSEVGATLIAWLADPAGAIALPSPRPKKPYPVAAE